jgi:hypothetical protein
MAFTSTLQTRPIDQWPGKLTRNRKRAPFRSGYGQTMNLLTRELEHLRATGIVLLMALRPQDIRLDGRPRADSRTEHPGVILCFNKPESVRMPCDAFDDWSDNLRAIALSLEALRKVDRYGVSKCSEQYKGWAALPPPNGDHWTKQQAWEFIAAMIGRGKDAPALSPTDMETAIRTCEFKTHPDHGGNSTDFHKVQQARKLLLV